MNDPYKTLGLSPSTAQAEVKKAYRQLAQKYHPDTGTHADAKRFVAIAEAYQFLKDQKKVIPGKPKENLYKERIDPKRKKGQETFYRSKFRLGVLKTIGTGLLFGLILLALGWLTDFYWLIGVALGILFGVLFGMKRFFDLGSFFRSPLLIWFDSFYGLSFIFMMLYLLFLALGL